MKTALKVGDITVGPGERVTQVLKVSIGEGQVDVPVIAVNGQEDGPRVAVTGGIHGAEYVGIEAARRLGMGLDPAEVHGSVVVVPIANTTSFFRRAIYTSGLDNRNLNRQFPGDQSGEPSQILADWLFNTVIRPSDYYIDLHGGDMIEALVPFVIYLQTDNKEVEEKSRQMALAAGIERVIRGTTSGSTYEAATQAGIPAILAEIGGQGLWTDAEVEAHRAGANHVLQHLGVLPHQPVPAHEPRFYDTFAWMRSEANGLFHPTVKVGEMVQQGQNLGQVVDYFGNELQRVDAVTGGEIVFLVTSLAINDGDPLLAIGA